MSEKHTPGPWEWGYFSGGYALVGRAAEGSSVRPAVRIEYDTPDGKLIAAAPDMAAQIERLKVERDELEKIAERILFVAWADRPVIEGELPHRILDADWMRLVEQARAILDRLKEPT